MHIPDGFIAPVMYIPAGGAAAALWVAQLRRLRTRLNVAVMPRLAALGAAMFVLMMLALPLPGGTSAHANGVALVALRFSLGPVYLVTGVVLFLQAIIFAQGGITTLGVNALALGLAAGTARSCLRLPLPAPARAMLAGALSVLAAALVTAVALGLQPILAHDSHGRPLYFPFPLSVTLPAILGSHLIVAIAEGFLTMTVDQLLGRLEAGRDRR